MYSFRFSKEQFMHSLYTNQIYKVKWTEKDFFNNCRNNICVFHLSRQPDYWDKHTWRQKSFESSVFLNGITFKAATINSLIIMYQIIMWKQSGVTCSDTPVPDVVTNTLESAINLASFI